MCKYSWFTKEVRILRQNRDESYKWAMAIGMKYNHNAEEAWKIYKVCRNEYSHAIRRSKSVRIQETIEVNRYDNKKLWDVLKNLLKQKPKSSSNICFESQVIEIQPDQIGSSLKR